MPAVPQVPAPSGSRLHDLGTFNRWLCFTRVRAVVALAGFAVAFHFIAPGVLPVTPVLVVGGLGLVFSAAALRSRWLAARPRGFFHLQHVVDLGLITAGLAIATSGVPGLVFRGLYGLVVVPAGLVSVPAGLAVAAGATAGHLFVLGLQSGFTLATCAGVEALGPSFLFFLLAQQCFFYGGHLDEKNRTLGALVEVARTLAETLDAPALLARVTQTMRDVLGADWSATFLVDPTSSTFRLVAATEPELPLAELGRLEFPLAGWPDLAALDRTPFITLVGAHARRVPAAFTGDRALDCALVAGLHREGVLVGALAVGYRRGTTTPASAERLFGAIAEHAAMALRNAQLLDEVRQASQLKSEFVGAVSHELRSPLNVILGYTEMLRDEALGPITPAQDTALERAQRQGVVLLEMITALLDLNRLEAGRLPIEPSAVDVPALLAEVLEQSPEAWRRPGVVLRIAPLPALLLHTDRVKLKTVLRNLVHNALKFTERGHVLVSAAAGPDGAVTFEVEDTGRGIPPAVLPHVFEMFRQGPDPVAGGVGLGLHIVRRFVEALGGAVTVESAVGCGTRFRVTLPREPATAVEAA